MDLYNSLDIKSKLAFVFFVLGKLCFIPSAYFILTKQTYLSKVSLSMYSFFIASSLVLSFISIKSKSINLDLLKNKIKKEETNSKTFVVKVENGKIVKIT